MGFSLRTIACVFLGFAAASGLAGGCSCGGTGLQDGASGGAGGGAGGQLFDVDGGEPCEVTCSNDLKSVVDCNNVVLHDCGDDQGCANGECIDDPCEAARISKSSYGCDYWALKTALRPQADGACFAVFIANTWEKPVHLTVEREGTKMDVSDFARIPAGQGPALSYEPFDEQAGLLPGEVAVLFLSRALLGGSVVECPVPAAIEGETGVAGTGRGAAFHITSDYPVVAYQISPYGGAQAYVTSATLLLPTSAWDTNYVAINAYKSSDPPIPGGHPSLDIVAREDDTEVTLLPTTAILPGEDVPGAPAGQPVTYKLSAGEFLQITQPEELTGSPIMATKPIGVFGAATCMNVPTDQGDCDSAQQQIAPVRALGSEYVAVRYRGRAGKADEVAPWRLVGVVDGTKLLWEGAKPIGAPDSLGLGDVLEVSSAGPFTVKSQDSEHPFYLGAYMTGGAAFEGEGDPDWINVIPPSQFLTRYVLFTDPTYPETSLVVVRAPSRVDGSFADVSLACRGTLTGWSAIGDYQYTRVTLVTGDFEGVKGCANGAHEMWSELPFGVSVWGWGATQQTRYVSYAYPAGAGFQPINEIKVLPEPK